MNNWPKYFKDRLIMGNLDSTNAIVTLWTPKETIQKLVDADSFSVMGQLYTKKGINYVIRNILANPFIKTICITGNDLMKSGDALLALFKNGVDDKNKVIGDESASLDKEITKSAIDLLRKNVKVVDLRESENLKLLREKIKTETSASLQRRASAQHARVGSSKSNPDDTSSSRPTLWSDPIILPEPEPIQTSHFPSEIDLIKIRRPTIAEAYLSALKHLDMFGLESEPPMNNASSDSKKMKELLNLSLIVTDEDPAKPFMPEYLNFSKEDLENYYKGFFDAEKKDQDYTYGGRLFNYAKDEIKELKKIYPWIEIDRFQKYSQHGGINQVSVSIIRKLRKFKYDKGAIALLGNVFTDVFPKRPPSKIPCLFLIQCQIYMDKLNLTAYFRSNDMYSAWPLNAFALRKLQADIAEKLQVGLGPLITISNMAHIYEHNFDDVSKLLSQHYPKYFCEWDGRGNYVITVENKKDIVVTLIAPNGADELKTWKIDGTAPHAARDICVRLEADLSLSNFGNAMYVGRQLERAETAIKLGLEFKQDNALNFKSS